jgi:hypothetical protein
VATGSGQGWREADVDRGGKRRWTTGMGQSGGREAAHGFT